MYMLTLRTKMFKYLLRPLLCLRIVALEGAHPPRHELRKIAQRKAGKRSRKMHHDADWFGDGVGFASSATTCSKCHQIARPQFRYIDLAYEM